MLTPSQPADPAPVAEEMDAPRHDVEEDHGPPAPSGGASPSTGGGVENAHLLRQLREENAQLREASAQLVELNARLEEELKRLEAELTRAQGGDLDRRVG